MLAGNRVASSFPRRPLAIAALALLALGACQKAPTPPVAPDTGALELQWARAALERNPDLEVIATDAESAVFTVRNRSSGEVRAVKLSELAAAPAADLKATSTPAPGAEAAPQPAAEQPAPETPAPAAFVAQAATPPAGTSTGYVIERAGGQVKVSGPGVSIVSSGLAGSGAQANDRAQRSSDPIICEGRRMLHFDNRTIYVDGDAITARGGCELHITNSRIVATGTGIVVRDATVHIGNSQIEGAAAAFDAGERARIYARGSTFQGVPRRAEGASVQDQGGNVWR